MIPALAAADFLMIGSFIFKFGSLPPQIPLFYSLPWGEDQLVDFWFILLLPILLHIFFFLNIYLYNKFFFPDHMIRRMVMVTNISLTAVITVIFLRVIFHVT